MYVVLETFTAKPGMGSKLATFFKEVFASVPALERLNTRVLSDVVGPFNTVVLETQVPDLEEFQRQMKEYMERPEIRERMKGYTDMWLTGKREVYRVV